MREFKIGDKVFNKAYGEGTVVATDSKQEDEQHPILVDHKESGVKTTYTVEGYYYDKDSLDSSCDIKHINNTKEKDMKCTTQAEVFTELARVAKLIEGTNLELRNVAKYTSTEGFPVDFIDIYGEPDGYSFALALVEGKPVFAGDKLWSITFKKYYTITGIVKSSFVTEESDNPYGTFEITNCTWKQPKKTFRLNGIELPLPDRIDNAAHSSFYYLDPDILIRYKWDTFGDKERVLKVIRDLLEDKQ